MRWSRDWVRCRLRGERGRIAVERCESLCETSQARSCRLTAATWKPCSRTISFDVTATFLDEALAFNPSFELGDLYQALRNVWIMNSQQLFRGSPIVYSPSIFAYSMLYPYTDNALDDRSTGPKREGPVRRASRGSVGGRGPEADFTSRSGCLSPHWHDRRRASEGPFPPRSMRVLLAIHRAPDEESRTTTTRAVAVRGRPSLPQSGERRHLGTCRRLPCGSTARP